MFLIAGCSGKAVLLFQSISLMSNSGAVSQSREKEKYQAEVFLMHQWEGKACRHENGWRRTRTTEIKIKSRKQAMDYR